MAYCLLGAHVNNTVGGLPETVVQWKPPLVVVLDHSDVWRDVKAASPQTTFVGRVYQEFEPDFNNADLDPHKAAQDHCDKVLPWAERMGATYRFWQGVNEPVIQSPAAMQRYADFETERIRIMEGHGFQVVVGSFSVGNPDLPLWHEFVPALEATLRSRGALALHEYSWPSLERESPWLLLRHRKVYGGEPTHGWAGLPEHLQSLPLLITECGLDGLLEPGYPPRGWKTLYEQNPEEYLRQLAWYDAELQKDLYVAGAAIYCCGIADWTWNSYDIWPQPAKTLAQEATPIYRLDQIYPPLPPEPADEDARWAEMFRRLDRIIELLEERA